MAIRIFRVKRGSGLLTTAHDIHSGNVSVK